MTTTTPTTPTHYEDLPEFNSVVVDINNLNSLLQRPGDHRNRIKTMIVQLRSSLQALSYAVDAQPAQPAQPAESKPHTPPAKKPHTPPVKTKK